MMLTLKPLLTPVQPVTPTPRPSPAPVAAQPRDGETPFGRTLRDAGRATEGDETEALMATAAPQDEQAVDEVDEVEVAEDETVVDEQPADVTDDTDAAAEAIAVVTPEAPRQPAKAQPQQTSAPAETTADDVEVISGEAKRDEPKVTPKAQPQSGVVREGDAGAQHQAAPQRTSGHAPTVQPVEPAAAPQAIKPAAPSPAPQVAVQVEQAVQQLEQGREVDPNVARVARGLQSALAQRGGSVTLRLHPPELGVVRIAVDIRDGVVRATFQAESESARTMLHHQIGKLRHALEGHGLVAERLEVQQPSSQSALQQQLADDNAEAEARSRGRREGSGGRRREEQQDNPTRFEQTLRDRAAG